MDRAAARVRGDLGRGINSLATVAAVAPLLGTLATLDGFVGAFRTCGRSETSPIVAALAGGFAEAFVPVSLGLAVGILASVFYRHLLTRWHELACQCH